MSYCIGEAWTEIAKRAAPPVCEPNSPASRPALDRLCYTGQKGGGTRDWFQNKRVSLGDLKSIEPVLGLPIQDRTQEEPGCTKLTDPLGRKECVYI
ncbi:hypothetical protein CBS63078_1523 [Aspergillus niger]|nr:hypothetical protein CBS11350_8684 [Aspergillus niger]KAI2901530.1 hypothetical protein CBS13152_1836 [Aspergillus niger]KAI2931197.1 hypothetical protein CBS63078_1523 [Aspergillus niger]KAI2975791.1 hypothetical protein CBS147323_775 [Aspergillus niger]KAI3007553.1 hypothetical protein CBS147482_5556 [Aspergillus niger]